MYRSTFNIIARYISQENKVTINFDTEGEAYATPENNAIHLPQNVGDKNAFGTLALLMHESAHLLYSRDAINHLDKNNEEEMSTFNVLEDIRIDRKNFARLPNIKSFYRKMMEDHCDHSKDDPRSVPFVTKVLCNAILQLEGFEEFSFQDKSVNRFLKTSPLLDLIRRGIDEIERQSWPEVKRTIKEINDLLNNEKQKQDKPVKGKAKSGQGGLAEEIKKAQIKPDLSDPGNKLVGPDMPSIYLDAQTEQCFKELLNIKERRVIDDGLRLDTDNLTAFFTGDVEGLFKDDITIKTKKSKVLLLLDGSGSMGEPLLDNKSRWEVVKKCAKKLGAILAEVSDLEGLNVDWEFWVFDTSATRIGKTVDGYRASGGGTNLSCSYREVLENISKDPAEGKKIIVILTDGDVGADQIVEMKKDILRTHADVRTLVIGVGTDPAGSMAQEILGDNVIVAEENASQVILEAVRRLL